MNLKHIEVFLAVAQCGSMNKAAQILYTSQPYLSYVIRDLEVSLGYPLFRRSKKGMSLTREGEDFLEHANIISREMQALRTLKREPRQEPDTLSISMTKFTHIMESCIHICRQRQELSRFEYRFHEGSTRQVLEDVASGQANLGVINYAGYMKEEISRFLEANDLQRQELGCYPPHIVLSKNHVLLQQNKEVTLAALAPYGLVRYLGDDEDFTYDMVFYGATDVERPARVVYVEGRAALHHFIAATNLYTIGIQEFSTQDSMYQNLSLPVRECGEALIFDLVIPRRGHLSDSGQAFVQHVTRSFRAMNAPLTAAGTGTSQRKSQPDRG